MKFSSVFLVAAVLLTAGCASTGGDNNTQVAGQLETAKQLIDKGQYNEAIMSLQVLRQKAPREHRIDGYLGIAFLGLGDFRAAIKAFERSLEVKEDDNTKLNLSLALIAQKTYPRAKMLLEEVIADKKYIQMEKVYNNLGLVLMQEKKCKLALDKFDEALQIDPTFISAHFNSGKCYLQEKRYLEAQTSFKQASNFCPGCPEPAIELAHAQYLAGKKKDAIAQLENLLKKDMDEANTEKTRKLLQIIRK